MNFADQLLKQMTLAEKAGQMTQLTIDTLYKGEPMKLQRPLEINEAELDRIVRQKMVGSILNVPSGYLPAKGEWHTIIGRIQEKSRQTRLQIPVLYGIDAIHGVNYCRDATLYPQPISIAAGFNPELAKSVAAATAYECRAAGLPWNFSPALDIGRTPAWPRLWESFGEDVLVNSIMGAATVEGYQQNTLGDRSQVAACLKHFTGYGLPLSGKDRTPAWIPEIYLREYFLPAYQAAIDAGAMSIMVNSGEINGLPVHADYFLLTEILRGEMGFEGLLVTDWRDIEYLHTRHRIASSQKEAVRLAIEAGIDMSMTPFTTDFTDHLIALVEEGSISESRIDQSVRRILMLKDQLGLFDPPVENSKAYPLFGSDRFQDLSKTAARDSIVLLKNSDSILPLPKNANFLVCGPAFDHQQALNGGWTASWQGELANEALQAFPSILEAVRQKVGADRVNPVKGAGYQEMINFQDAIWAAQEADYVLLCLGEDSYTEDYGNLDDLYLSDAQTELALALCQTGKPVILILTGGRPRLISKFESALKAVIGAFYPGPHGGTAIADILFGDYNPNGKLPFTYPRYPNSLVPYDHKYTEDREICKSGKSFNPQFEFGHGLSYTTFEYSDLRLNKTTFSTQETIEVELTIRNTGKLAGKETVLVFISDLYASITPPVKRLRDFQKIELPPGRVQKVSFRIQPESLAFVGVDMQWVIEPGVFAMQIGPLTTTFEII